MKEKEEEGMETKHSGCVFVCLRKTRVSKCIEHNFFVLLVVKNLKSLLAEKIKEKSLDEFFSQKFQHNTRLLD